MDFNFRNMSPWLDELPYDWDSYKNEGTRMFLEKARFVFHTGNSFRSIYIVLHGRVRLFSLTPEGKEKTVMIIGKNGLLGDHFLSENHAYSINAKTVSDSVLLKVDKKKFEQLAFSNRSLTKQWLEMLSLKLEILIHSSPNLSFDSSSKRLAQTLVQLGTTYGIKQSNGIIKISITFTHQELADLIGSSRVTVSNEINKLQGQGIITKPEKHYYINSMEQLKDQT